MHLKIWPKFYSSNLGYDKIKLNFFFGQNSLETFYLGITDSDFLKNKY